MTIKKRIYISGPRMGTSNLIKGMELPLRKSKKKKTKRRKK
jgi:hypothetical protein